MLQPTQAERQDIVRKIFGERLANQANSSRFQAYFNHYCSIVCPAISGDAVIDFDTPVLETHDDILRCVELVTQNPGITFKEFVTKAVECKAGEASLREKEHVARVTVDVAFGVNCTLKDYYSDGFQRSGPYHLKWEGDVPFVDFIKDAFASQQGQVSGEQILKLTTYKKSLKAWKLAKRYGIKTRGTDNLLEHLVFDAKTMTLRVFHQVSCLRAHLEKSKKEPLDLSFEESLRRGTLPPQLLLETLLTFHDILFPVASVGDKKSYEALETMIRKHGFDAEGRWVEFVRATPPDMRFEYWGSRLSTLHEVVKRPPPTNALIAWFERHTSERNALTVAILGLFLSALFGLLSFIIGLLQLVLAWVAYKYPAAPTQ